MGVEDMVGQRIGGRVVGHVGHHTGDPAGVTGRQGGHRGVQYGLFDVGHDDGGIGLQQRPDDAPTDAVGPTGDHGDRAGDLDGCQVGHAAAWVWLCGAMPGQPLAVSGISS